MVRQNDVGRKILESGRKRFGRIDSLYDGVHARALELECNELCIALAVFEK